MFSCVPQQDGATRSSIRPMVGDYGRFLSVFVPVAATRGRRWFLLDSGNIAGTLAPRHVVREGLVPIQSGGTFR